MVNIAKATEYRDGLAAVVNTALKEKYAQGSVEPWDFYCALVMLLDSYRAEVFGGNGNLLETPNLANYAVYDLLAAGAAEGKEAAGDD